MAVIGGAVPTLLEVAQRLNPDGTQADIAELLTKTNPVLEDMPWYEGNLLTGHRFTVRTSLPTPTWRAINEGVPVSKSTSAQVDETCGMLENFSQCDRELAILSGNVDGFRLTEAAPHMEGMNQAMAAQVFYGNVAANPKAFTGFGPRYGALSGTNQSVQIIDAGGTGSNLRDVWLIGWGPRRVYGIYPKNTIGGLQHEDATTPAGSQIAGAPPAMPLNDPNGNRYMGYLDHWVWRCGLAVEDYRYIVRIANISEALLTANKATGPDLQDLMVQAMHRIQQLDGAVFYMDRLTQSFLDRQLLATKNAYLSYADIAGKRTLTFGTVPVKRTDALNVAQSRIS